MDTANNCDSFAVVSDASVHVVNVEAEPTDTQAAAIHVACEVVRCAWASVGKNRQRLCLLFVAGTDAGNVRNVIEGVLSEGDTPFMFISPSDTKNLISTIMNDFPTQVLNYSRSWVDPSSYTSALGTGLGVAPSGYGSDYDMLFAANPYRNLNYNQSWWQKVASQLGFRTDYDRWKEDAQVNAAEYDAGIFSQIQQNNYNSPAAMAARMRAAGQNPDLLGTQGVATAASPVEDPNGMSPNEAGSQIQPLQILQSVSQTCLDLIPTTMSFVTNLQQLKGIRTDNEMKELQFGNQAFDAAVKFFDESVTADEYRQAYETNDWQRILDAAQSSAFWLSSNFLSSPRSRRKFNLAFNLHSRSLLAQIQKYKNYDEFEKARKSLLSQRASSFFSDDDETMKELLSGFLQPIERYQQTMNDINERYASQVDKNKLPEARANLESAQISNQVAYEGAINPTLQAEAENALNEYQKQYQEIQTATDTLFSDIMTALKSHDNWWSKIAMALIGIARAQLMSGMSLQFGRHSQYHSEGVNADGSVYGGSSQSNFGISF